MRIKFKYYGRIALILSSSNNEFRQVYIKRGLTKAHQFCLYDLHSLRSVFTTWSSHDDCRNQLTQLLQRAVTPRSFLFPRHLLSGAMLYGNGNFLHNIKNYTSSKYVLVACEQNILGSNNTQSLPDLRSIVHKRVKSSGIKHEYLNTFTVSVALRYGELSNIKRWSDLRLVDTQSVTVRHHSKWSTASFNINLQLTTTAYLYNMY